MAEIRLEDGRDEATDGESRTYLEGRFLTAPGPLRPLVGLVASIRVGVHTKLLTGFLIGALLLLGMGILSLLVIARMSQRVDQLTRLQDKVDRSRQMEYAVTAQMHFRAMALLTNDDSNNEKIAAAKRGFLENLDAVERISPPERDGFFQQVKETNDRFTASSARALYLYNTGAIDEALTLHLAEEHQISHELETAMRVLVRDAGQETSEASDAFQSDRVFLTAMVGTFSGSSLAVALLLGFVLSWLVIEPLRRMGQGMRRIASGNFSQPVNIANRDELGELAVRINQTAQELGKLHEATLAEERARALQERIVQVTLAQEEERRRISRELHDGLGPSLAAVANRIRACRHMVRNDWERAEKDLKEIADGLTGHIREIRALTHNLRPLTLDQLGLVRALSQHVEKFSHETGISASFSTSGDIALNPLAEVTVFRVVQECLSNVQRHSEASQVDVRLEATDHSLEVAVRDNGRGIDPRDVAADATERGLGLVSMRERAELLKGSLSVESSPGSGCQVVLKIPLKETEVGLHSNPPGG